MKSNLQGILGTYIKTLDQRIESARQQGLLATEKVKRAPHQQIYLSNVERSQSIKEELYKQLLSKREDLMINQPAIEGSAKIVDEARVFPSPIAPDEKRWTLIGLLIGLAIPILLFILSRILDTTVGSRHDIEDAVKIPFVGEIPLKAKKDEREIVVEDKKRDSISEAFRGVRTNIDYLVNKDAGAKV